MSDVYSAHAMNSQTDCEVRRYCLSLDEQADKMMVDLVSELKFGETVT